MPDSRAEPDAPSEQPPPPSGARPARARCPRCGAPLGVLSADPSEAADTRYCGCCGLVLPAA